MKPHAIIACVAALALCSCWHWDRHHNPPPPATNYYVNPAPSRTIVVNKAHPKPHKKVDKRHHGYTKKYNPPPPHHR